LKICFWQFGGYDPLPISANDTIKSKGASKIFLKRGLKIVIAVLAVCWLKINKKLN